MKKKKLAYGIGGAESVMVCAMFRYYKMYRAIRTDLCQLHCWHFFTIRFSKKKKKNANHF